MNAINTTYQTETENISQIGILLWDFIKEEQIEEYNREKHISWEYRDDFIYIYDKDNNKIYIIKNSELWYFESIDSTLDSKYYETFCYSKTNTWTTYNSYKPEGESYILNTKARIDNIIDLKTNK